MIKIMKKQYIFPEVFCEQTLLESLLNQASITVNSGDLDNPIPVGGEAGDGENSDSRRSVWSDYGDGF